MREWRSLLSVVVGTDGSLSAVAALEVRVNYLGDGLAFNW